MINDLFNDSGKIMSDLKQIKFKQMINQTHPVPRLIAIQSLHENDKIPTYRHPNDCEPKNEEMCDIVLSIKKKIEEVILEKYNLKYEFNHVLIQYYRNGKDNISEHSDKTLDIDNDTPIVNVSYGVTRTMVIKNKKTKEKQKILLIDNSALIFGLKTNTEWLHEIPKTVQNGERISLTFRKINTFLTNNGIVYGQGSPFKTINDIKIDQISNDRDEMIIAFSIENNRYKFDKEKYYGCGFYHTPNILDNLK
jgi:alkylated DNA repair dioxygenase AlkB